MADLFFLICPPQRIVKAIFENSRAYEGLRKPAGWFYLQSRLAILSEPEFFIHRD